MWVSWLCSETYLTLIGGCSSELRSKRLNVDAKLLKFETICEVRGLESCWWKKLKHTKCSFQFSSLYTACKMPKVSYARRVCFSTNEKSGSNDGFKIRQSRLIFADPLDNKLPVKKTWFCSGEKGENWQYSKSDVEGQDLYSLPSLPTVKFTAENFALSAVSCSIPRIWGPHIWCGFVFRFLCSAKIGVRVCVPYSVCIHVF